jgi:lipopolysaccharide/colanic/teichoic acid biosynthesis glycosyltransferase
MASANPARDISLDKILRRSFDIVVSAVGLVLLAFPFAVISLAIKLSSPGPVLYRQQRIGRSEKPFWLYKFRTMHVSLDGPLITVQGDPRITRVGKALRRWKLDELPQLWNVLCGDMSIIGPRPEVERLVRYYTPEQKRLLQGTPGLAGLSQLVYPHEADVLQGYPNPEEVYRQHLMPRKLAVDLEYERHRTFWSDLLLLAEIILLSVIGKSYRIDRNFSIPFYKEAPSHPLPSHQCACQSPSNDLRGSPLRNG